MSKSSVSKKASVGNNDGPSSYDVFMNFVDMDTNDASRILSKDCYDTWVGTRKSLLKQPEESFRRVLTAHVCGLIGRKPFPADIEINLLKCLRRKQTWPCFCTPEDQMAGITIGVKGFRKTGFHEARRGIFGANASASNLRAGPTSVQVPKLNAFLAKTQSQSPSSKGKVSQGKPIDLNVITPKKRTVDELEAEPQPTTEHIINMNTTPVGYPYGVNIMGFGVGYDPSAFSTYGSQNISFPFKNGQAVNQTGLMGNNKKLKPIKPADDYINLHQNVLRSIPPNGFADKSGASSLEHKHDTSVLNLGRMAQFASAAENSLNVNWSGSAG